MAGQPPPTGKPGPAEASSEFTSYYLQRATKEFAEDLDKVRGADDFKNDAIGMLVHALRQGITMFSEDDQKRILGVEPPQAAPAESSAPNGAGSR